MTSIITKMGDNPRLIWGLLRKYWMLVLFVTLTGVGISYIYNQYTTPIYTSSISLLIWNRDIDKIKIDQKKLAENNDNEQVNDVMKYNSMISMSLHVAQRLVPAFRKLINSPVVKEATAKKLYQQGFAKPLNYTFACIVKINSCIMDVNVTSPDPKLATAAAIALTESFAAEQECHMRVRYIQAITPASIPKFPSWPIKKLSLSMGLLAGLLFGGIIAVCIELLDVTIKTSDDVKNFKLLTLGLVPTVSDIETLYNTKKNEQKGHLHVIIDAFRVINTTIGFLRVNNPLQVISITSALPKSGKTTNAIMLGKVMGASHKRVLIIDCDLRKPKLMQSLSLKGDDGLVKFLINPEETDPKRSIRKNVFPGVDVMPNSLIPPNPTELLGAQKFKEMLEQLKKDYDCILLDCPPGLNMADAMVVGNIVDGIVLIIEAGKTKSKEMEHLLEQFGVLRPKIIGTVLNKVSLNNNKYSYYSYYGKTPGSEDSQ